MRVMLRFVILSVVLALTALAANIKLYLKDGTTHMVREYQVLEDRVRYYSTERGDWEEIPKELVDLERTKKEISRREEEERESIKADAEEDEALRAARKEIARIPAEAGVYWINGPELTPLELAESEMVIDKKRKILRVLSPIPMIPGKGTVELKGESANRRIEEPRPQFYIRLSKEQQFGLIRMWPAKNARIVEKLMIEPVSKMIFEEQQKVETFRQQVGEGLYKIWPVEPLEPGEYALVEFTPAEESGVNIQVFDFGIGAPGSAPPVKETKRPSGKDAKKPAAKKK